MLTLQGHNVATRALHHLGNHIINEAVLVPDLLLLELLGVGSVIDLLEDILESSIILLQNGVLGAHVQWQALAESELETGMCEALDRLIGVVLCLGNSATGLELEDFNLLWLSTLWGEDHGELAITLHNKVLGSVLVTKGVAANDDRLLPAWNEAGNTIDDNWLTENGTAKGISDGPVRGEPH